jgi:predicted alpha/beta hydrolase family esterase
MKNAIIIHGKPGKKEYYSDEYPVSSNFAWIPWLQKQLIINDIKTDTPEMPHAYEPQYKIWKTEFERFDITPETILVGHSCGGGFLLRWLSENKEIKVGKVILVAPWIDPEKENKYDFFRDFEIDPDFTQRTSETVVFTSDNDFESCRESASIVSRTSPEVRVVTFEGYGHFIPSHMGTDIFLELLEEILK